ncbi:hypothetical protein GCM10009812_01380 [Nocardioides marinus]|uniref:GH26 domain-containing protein n=3 Tax=Nocardioides marinus TaxID=374514 RepID=A0A7Z0C6G1_9ACTN|nr:glycosyl hydrolase [Nocardioides marinus]NYI12116.1 hypothetical protein [Nocardioides marinus]
MTGESRRSRRAAATFALAVALVATGAFHMLLVTTDLDGAFAGTRDTAEASPDAGPTPQPTPPSTPGALPLDPPPSTADPTPTEPVRTCRPRTEPVDPEADAAALCLAETLDRWLADGVTAVGQQVNISSDSWDEPLWRLEPQRPAVVGFDLDELVAAARRGTDWTEDLALMAADGVVLTASWHAPNPFSGGDSFDRSGADRLDVLLKQDSVPARRFDEEWAEVLDALARLQEQGAAVLVRPLHEAGGSWFWWGRPDPSTYRALFAHLQQRAADAGVHNLLWSYGAAVRTWEGVDEPLSLLPDRVDLVGLDTYDCESPHPDCGGRDADELARDEVDLTGYAELVAAAPRAALTEVGPAHSPDGTWDPAVITRTLAEQGLPAAYALLWFDDSFGRKQVSSLKGGQAWLQSCPDALCPVGAAG